MLSYQHGYHAGNRADVLKHAVLYDILKTVAAGPRPILYVETHSGRGIYDLNGEQSRKGGEADEGILDLIDKKVPRPMREWVDFVRSKGISTYPGSPALAQSILPANSRHVFFEKHPTEFAELQKAIGDDERSQIKRADGYSGALKLAPRAREQMVCFVDPSFETERDIEALALWTPKALKRWPHAIIILWLPLFKDQREIEYGEYLSGLESGFISGARWPTDPMDETALEGTAIVAYRAPKECETKGIAIQEALQSWWSNSQV